MSANGHLISNDYRQYRSRSMNARRVSMTIDWHSDWEMNGRHACPARSDRLQTITVNREDESRNLFTDHCVNDLRVLEWIDPRILSTTMTSDYWNLEQASFAIRKALTLVVPINLLLHRRGSDWYRQWQIETKRCTSLDTSQTNNHSSQISSR